MSPRELWRRFRAWGREPADVGTVLFAYFVIPLVAAIATFFVLSARPEPSREEIIDRAVTEALRDRP